MAKTEPCRVAYGVLLALALGCSASANSPAGSDVPATSGGYPAGGGQSTSGGLASGVGSSSGASAGSSGATGGTTSMGGSGTGGALDPCANGVQDGTETGVDCGGSCPACNVIYRLNPPDPCFDQFYLSDCQNGSSPSCSARIGTRGCTVANVCEDDTSKIGLPVTFACPRHMLFSSEMVQAAKDDTLAYGWGTAGDSAFNYAVAGHDSGDLDTGLPDTCCQCYQLVLGRPLDDAPQPPLIPIPKPLIVQTFNTAAGGGNNFDIYMAVGGYGAFNGCYDDPNFGNTKRTYGVFAYTGFPDPTALSGGANMFYYEGGLRYKNLVECQSTVWPPTADAVMSSTCQSRVAELCNQITAPSAAVTATSRNSCIQGNQVESLYHQNWQEVRAKRVECPESLTRVTGCRLQNQGLPAPNPNVRTPTQAAADSTFRTGYGITTMQDCCKPTCAWSNNVRSPVDGAWRSFYSCNANGDPMTAP